MLYLYLKCFVLFSGEGLMTSHHVANISSRKRNRLKLPQLVAEREETPCRQCEWI